VQVDEGTDIGLELPEGDVNTSLDLFSVSSANQRSMDMIMRPAGEPRFDLGCLVRGAIIHDDMDTEPFRSFSIDFF
jgi:hypothetical protein